MYDVRSGLPAKARGRPGKLPSTAVPLLSRTTTDATTSVKMSPPRPLSWLLPNQGERAEATKSGKPDPHRHGVRQPDPLSPEVRPRVVSSTTSGPGSRRQRAFAPRTCLPLPFPCFSDNPTPQSTSPTSGRKKYDVRSGLPAKARGRPADLPPTTVSPAFPNNPTPQSTSPTSGRK